MCVLNIELSYAGFFFNSFLKAKCNETLVQLGIKATMRIRDYLHSILLEITI